MLSNLPVARSEGARTLFLVTAGITAAILLWSHNLQLHGQTNGLAPIFFALFTYFDSRAATWTLLLLIAALLVPARLSFRPLLRWFGENPVIVAAVTLITFCAGTLTVYHNHPLSMDEYAALFQAQAFASGHLTGQFPVALLDWLIPKDFQNYFLDVSPATGEVASSYWPSFALLLTPFAWLSIPWVCNPLISAATVLVIHRLALRIFADPEAAGLAVLLTVASPVFFANGISYYSMPAHLLANALYALLLLQPTRPKAFAAGVVGSIALTLHNPVPHTLFAIPWMIWTLTRPKGWRDFVWLCAGYLPLSLLLGIGWFWFCGHLMHAAASEGASAAASSDLAGSAERIGGAFGLPSSTVVLARLIGLAKIWLWAVPGLLLLAGAGAWRWRHDVRCRLLLASALLTFAGYLFVPADQGHGWGFRYFHSAWIALPLLATAALTPVPAVAQNGRQDEGLRTFVVACALLSLIAAVGLRAAQINEFVTDNLSQVPAYQGTERRIVLIDPSRSFYGQDLIQNDPRLRGSPTRMLSHGSRNDAEMMAKFFPEFHRVYRDSFGSVWTPTPTPIAGDPK